MLRLDASLHTLVLTGPCTFINDYTAGSYFLILFIGFSVAPTPYWSYGDFQLLLVKEDPTRTDIGIFMYG